MAQYEEQNQLDYRQGGDTVDDFARKHMAETTRIFRFLNDLRSNTTNSIEYTEPVANQLKAEDGKLYIRNGSNTAWILLGNIDTNFGFKPADADFISSEELPHDKIEDVNDLEFDKVVTTDELPTSKITDVNNLDFSKVVTTDDVATATGTGVVGKVIKTNADGLLDADITGNAAKLAGIRVASDIIRDGQVLTYRSATNTWTNENKGVIGSGRALNLYDGDTLLCSYVGDETRDFDLGITANKQYADDKADEAKQYADDKADEAKQYADDKADEAKQYAIDTVDSKADGACPIKAWADSTQYHADDIVIYNGKIYQCLEDNTDATFDYEHWTCITNGFRVGDIKAIAYNGDIEEGWLLCNGASVSRTMYADLFAKIGTTFGAVDDTHFNLPDLRDKFIEGAETAGTNKSAGLPNITGSWSPVESTYIDGTYSGAFGKTSGSTTRNYSRDYTGAGSPSFTFDASRSSSIYGNSTTVQPPALTMRYVIKAFDGQTADSALIDVTQYANELTDIRARYLPLSGGTMTSSYAVIKQSSATGILALQSGTSAGTGHGAAIYLHGESSAGYPGTFRLMAGSANGYKYLQGSANNGNLVWGTDKVLDESDILTFEEIEASTSLTGYDVASAGAVKSLNNKITISDSDFIVSYIYNAGVSSWTEQTYTIDTRGYKKIRLECFCGGGTYATTVVDRDILALRNIVQNSLYNTDTNIMCTLSTTALKVAYKSASLAVGVIVIGYK